jgi:hypothetical protein
MAAKINLHVSFVLESNDGNQRAGTDDCPDGVGRQTEQFADSVNSASKKKCPIEANKKVKYLGGVCVLIAMAMREKMEE